MNVIVLCGYGLNCEEETAYAFMEAGLKLKYNVKVDVIHINEIIDNPKQLKLYHVLAIPGGFSYGDNTGAGNALSLRILNNLWDEIQEFLSQDKLMIGVCNGCQVLVRLIPDFANIALTHNDTGCYKCCWVNVQVNKKCNSPWLQGLNKLHIPIAHGEGKFYMEQDVLSKLINDDSIALRYVESDTQPYNPNGSVYDIAAVSDKSGKILALMPHPERAIFFTQQENWPLMKEKCLRNNIALPKYGDGMLIFENAVRYFHH
ncbi:phosphoribosylformylglycinamidine synthase subunit PurQ [Candidatus Mesenet endosymbiont of Agriotes lineatus]|uniref:phosphoribosylformylglycinamidine synthase subunit PurQ n=1 Tax=Candidatus Mesenet endosymbiont of Agriotes lineatus TaxID=3077948 RepID=UPI0030D32093